MKTIISKNLVQQTHSNSILSGAYPEKTKKTNWGTGDPHDQEIVMCLNTTGPPPSNVFGVQSALDPQAGLGFTDSRHITG